jgi:hypothetical protein
MIDKQNQNLFGFILVITLWNVLFRFTLSSLLENENWNYVFLPPIIFFFAMYFSGRYFGLKQWRRLPIDQSFKYHLSTFSVFFVVSYGFYFGNLLSEHEPRAILDYTFLFWGLGLIIHYIKFRKCSKTSIKGINRDQIFD